MFEKYNLYTANVEVIMQSQESVFEHFFGSLPNEVDRYYSPFRSDSKPDCRFSYHNNTWYFIDNATHNNKLSFNCIEFVQHLYECTFTEAMAIITTEVKLEIKKGYTVDFIPRLRVVYKTITNNDNYWYRNYKLPFEYLKEQNVKRVLRYWCSTRKHNFLKVNALYNPKEIETYLYQFDSRKELYFPGQEIKFYKTTNLSDHYGSITDDYVVIVEGKKDQMILNHHYDLSCQGLQTVYSTPEYPAELKKIILLDPDSAGIRNSKRLMEHYPNAVNLTNENFKMDIADLFQNNKLKPIINLIKNEISNY
jgi:5S rRNA maturation endonuclease (ribonuclease M5)